MSRALLFRLLRDIKIPKDFPYEIGIPLVPLVITGHLCYAIGTKEEKEIIVSKKYKFDRNGFTEFMIIDNSGKHYNLNNSIWFWKWNSIEDWNLIQENKKIAIKFYGWRVPLFGIFPNIVNSNYLDTKPVICLEGGLNVPLVTGAGGK